MDSETIRVLIADDIPEVRENLRKLLYFEQDIEVVGVATDGQEAVAMTEDLQPDIVLMDINMPGMDGITASESISDAAPGVQIIMMSVQGETDYLRRSMLAGAKGFLIKPFGSDEMVTTIHNVYSLRPKTAPAPSAGRQETRQHQARQVPAQPVRQSRSEEGQIISVFSPKGGVGCSLLATNLAIALRQATEKRVLLVDGGLQFGDVGVLLNLTPNHTLVELAEKQGQMDNELLDVLLTPHLSGIKALLGPPRPEEAELLTADHLREALEVLQDMFDYIIIDVPSTLDDLTLSIFDITELILLVATPEITSIKSARLMFDVTEAMEYPEEKIQLILNKVERQGSINPDRIAAGIKHPIFASLPADTKASQNAINQGVPCVIEDPDTPLAQGMTKLAQQLLTQMGAVETEEPEPEAKPKAKAGSILSRLLKR